MYCGTNIEATQLRNNRYNSGSLVDIEGYHKKMLKHCSCVGAMTFGL